MGHRPVKTLLHLGDLELVWELSRGVLEGLLALKPGGWLELM
jgi:hypothetical protein